MGNEGTVESLIIDKRLSESPRGGVTATNKGFGGASDFLDDASDDMEEVEDDAYGVSPAIGTGQDPCSFSSFIKCSLCSCSFCC